MDWGKAKTVLILSFLMLNVLLGFQLWNDYKETRSSPSFNGLTEDIQAIMQQKQIRLGLDTKIPKETPSLQITVTFNQTVSTEQQVPLDPQIETKAVFNRKQLEKALQGKAEHTEHYELDPVTSGGGVFVLQQMYGGYPLFEMKMKLYHENQKITAFSQSYADKPLGNGEPKQQVLSAYKAVGRVIENYLPNGSAIQDVRLGYHGQSFNSPVQVLAPYWRIAIEGGGIYYVHAISGAVEDPSQKEKQEWE
ncbi:two-component system regulatory protein YycI [Paenibacillus gansuensis]|uniref:Two-component system regulatory protein YycI n=1 Tax=Paenibacillus gansuensis TaxID=306542 RepID=A0ABW5PKE7_9BACL